MPLNLKAKPSINAIVEAVTTTKTNQYDSEFGTDLDRTISWRHKHLQPWRIPTPLKYALLLHIPIKINQPDKFP